MTDNPHPPKAWACANPCCDRVLGRVIIRSSNTTIRHLELFRVSVRPGDDGQVIALATGTVEAITCSACGWARTWHADEAAINELVEKELFKRGMEGGMPACQRMISPVG